MCVGHQVSYNTCSDQYRDYPNLGTAVHAAPFVQGIACDAVMQLVFELLSASCMLVPAAAACICGSIVMVLAEITPARVLFF